jgi:hypothetical protein
MAMRVSNPMQSYHMERKNMDIRPKVRNAVLLGALAAVTATAWATSEEMSDDSAYVPPAVQTVVVTPSEPVVVSESLAPTETVVTTTETVIVPAPAIIVDRTVTQPAVTIEERRLTEDQRIQAVVMDRLATSNISGKIGVESNDSVVTLSGWTTTAMQADRASRTARGVIGVRYVQNEIRPRIGGSAS